MSRLSIQLGFWSALLSAIAFLIFTFCFVAIVVTAPLFLWTNLTDYIAYVNANNQFFAHLARLCMLLFGPLFVILLGWSLFLGLSSLFVAPVFGGNRLENVIKIAFLLNAIFCLVGGIAYVFEIKWLLFITINFGMGGAVMAVTVALAIMFKRLRHV